MPNVGLSAHTSKYLIETRMYSVYVHRYSYYDFDRLTLDSIQFAIDLGVSAHVRKKIPRLC